MIPQAVVFEVVSFTAKSVTIMPVKPAVIIPVKPAVIMPVRPAVIIPVLDVWSAEQGSTSVLFVAYPAVIMPAFAVIDAKSSVAAKTVVGIHPLIVFILISP